MSDSSPSAKGGIPSWQRTFSGETKSESRTPVTQPQNEPATGVSQGPREDETQVDQAVRFLREARIKEYSLGQKVSFLESKGVRKEAISRAIEIAENDVNSLENSPSDTSSQSQSDPDTSEATIASPQEKLAPLLPQRDAPPIITYPEFLLHANKPAPLITFSRLLNTAYIASGVAAAIYGTSKYLITPMAETLTDARHDFALHTLARLEELNNRLHDTVSRSPHLELSKRNQTLATDKADDGFGSESDTTASDPTELFHRDFGTQTSPALDEASSNAYVESNSSLDNSHRVQDDDPISYQTQKLKELHSLFADLLEESQSNGATADDVSEHIGALQTYLDDLQYPSNLWSGSQYNQYGGFGPPDAKKEDDEISRVKAEIRGVKGFFLSTRNFPGTARTPRPPVSSYG